jgi:Na+/H+ antiporter NhaB
LFCFGVFTTRESSHADDDDDDDDEHHQLQAKTKGCEQANAFLRRVVLGAGYALVVMAETRLSKHLGVCDNVPDE